MSLAKFDELDSLIRGMLYIETKNPHECYYWSHPTEESQCRQEPYDFSEPYPFLVRFRHSTLSTRMHISIDRALRKSILQTANLTKIQQTKLNKSKTVN